jgi:hypothetical protein
MLLELSIMLLGLSITFPELSIMLLELSVTYLESIYSTGFTYNRHLRS